METEESETHGRKGEKKRRSRLDFHPHPFIFLPNSGLNVSCCSIGTVSDADNGNNSFHQMVIFSGCWTFTKDSFSANSWPKIFAIHCCCEQHLLSYLPTTTTNLFQCGTWKLRRHQPRLFPRFWTCNLDVELILGRIFISLNVKGLIIVIVIQLNKNCYNTDPWIILLLEFKNQDLGKEGIEIDHWFDIFIGQTSK